MNNNLVVCLESIGLLYAAFHPATSHSKWEEPKNYLRKLFLDAYTDEIYYILPAGCHDRYSNNLQEPWMTAIERYWAYFSLVEEQDIYSFTNH